MPTNKKLSVAIIGAAGYSGVELLRLLSTHPYVEVRAITSRTHAGKALEQVHSQFIANAFPKFTDPDHLRWEDHGLIFFATPSGVAMRNADKALQHGTRIIDVSADFRLHDPKEWAKWYGEKHLATKLLPEAVYGLPEFYRDDIAKTRLLANPGCYPTTILLAVMPLLAGDCIAEDTIRVSAISGLSGAGRQTSLKYMLTETHSSVNAYAASGHRHLAEMLQQLRAINPKTRLEFVPHLAPMSRGIHATIFVDLKANTSVEQLHKALEQHYQSAPFVEVMPMGAYPRSGDVCASNLCKIAVHPSSEPGRAIILSVTDNLVKGAAGLAVQNMNLMYDWPEETGLSVTGIRP